MYLKKVALRDVRCFESIELTFQHAKEGEPRQRNWNVIVAENADGKTTLLQRPDHLIETKRKAREVLHDLLEDGYLGAIRQILLDSPALRESIVAAMPELAAVVASFARPPRAQAS